MAALFHVTAHTSTVDPTVFVVDVEVAAKVEHGDFLHDESVVSHLH